MSQAKLRVLKSELRVVPVEASNVTITSMRLEGDDPNLTSGVVVGGKGLTARP
jgi:hypothetical protein